MKAWRAFAAVSALPVLFTALVLIDVQRNRVAGRAPIELTQREVGLSAVSDTNSGMTARMNWSTESASGRRWLSADRMRSLGFDEKLGQRNRATGRYYSRQLPRRAYIVLELQDQPAPRSRLVPIDASVDRDELLAKYPDGRTHLITAGVIAARQDNRPLAPPYVDGFLVSLDPVGIHVPKEFAERLRNRTQGGAAFTLVVRFGSRLEPWIVDVR